MKRMVCVWLLCWPGIGRTVEPSAFAAPGVSSLQTVPAVHRKFRATGEMMAALPGALVHGLGHAYAGKTGRFLLLFGSEVVALGGMSYTATNDSNQLTRKENMAAGIGSALFVGGWLYDLVMTPGAVEEWNVDHGFGESRRTPLEVGADMLRTIGLPLPPRTPDAPPIAPPQPTGGPRHNVAVAGFEAQATAAADAQVVADWVRAELIRAGTANIVERAQMDKVLSEAAFQSSGCVAEGCAVKLGKLLNAERIVVGSFAAFLGEFVVTVGVVDVETGRVLYSDTARGRTADEVVAGIKALSTRLAPQL